jgi:2-oxoglutarate dehydrogenase complex dehydrogenase (E1) component-like enzyme
VRAFVLAVEYWHRFHKDVVVDVVGYRRNGHNEQDDPTLTQPITYEIIKKHPTCAEQYAARLRLDNVVDQSECDTWQAEKLKTWEEALALKSDFKECGATWLRSTWQVGNGPEEQFESVWRHLAQVHMAAGYWP